MIFSVQPRVFIGQEFLFLIDLLENDLSEISSQLLRAILLVDIYQLNDFISKLCPQSLILRSSFLVFLLQVDELIIDGLKSILKLLYLGLVSIEERNEGEFVLMENGMDIDGSIKLDILISWLYLELIMQGSQLVSKTIA